MSAERYTPERLMAWADKATQFSERDVMRRLAKAWERDKETIAELRDALSLARGYLAAVHGSLVPAVGENTLIKPDLDRVDKALAATDVQEAKPDE